MNSSPTRPNKSPHSHTVVVVNWNSWEILSHCLERLRNQTYQNFNVLIIDNASDTPPPDDLLARHPRATLIRNQSNLGFAAANNQAINLLADAEWLLLLNPDAFPEPDWIERLVDASQTNPQCTMFASRQLMDENLDLLDGDGDVYNISGLVWRNRHGMPVDSTELKLREVFSPCAAAGLYRADILRAIGGFDEDFFCYVEDVDLGFRLRLMGHRCLLVPDAVVRHIGSATSGGQRSDFSVYHGHRNLAWAYVKNMPGWLFWCCLPLHLAMNLAIVGAFIANGKGRVILKAKRDALLGLPKMWRKRQAIQKGRMASVSEIWRVLNKNLLPGNRYR